MKTRASHQGPRPRLRVQGSMATRLAVVYGLISAALIVAMGLGIYGFTARYLRDQAAEDLNALTRFYAAYTAGTVGDAEKLAALAPQIAAFFATQAEYDVRVFDGRTGTLLAATRDLGNLPSTAAFAELGFRRPTLFLAPSYDHPDRIYSALAVRAADGSMLGVVEVSRKIAAMEAFLGTLRVALLAAGGLAVGAALLTSLLVARRMIRPLNQIESATQAIASGDFSRRVDQMSNDEIGRLAASVNQMAAELSRLEQARRDFVAKISHDLRTPLTAIKGFVVNFQDTAPEDMLATLSIMDEQTDHLIRLVNDLLVLSQFQRGALTLRRTAVDLTAVARSATAIAQDRAARRGIALEQDLPDGMPLVYGDKERLQQVTINLLDNALKAAPVGGAVEVSVRPSAHEIALIIADNGHGLTPAEEARAFEPYFHGSGGGSGLGLTIAREIVIAHGGRIWLKARPSAGAEAGFALPLTARTRNGSQRKDKATL